MNYYISGNETYLKAADQTLDFYMKYFIDHTYGEVYQTTNQTGTPTTTTKASYWKAGYHSIELGYYVYLYGNLYLHKKPVTLYYDIQQVDSIRELKLYPLAIEDNKLKISDVQLNGQSYTNFSSSTRKLNIPSGIGGIFKVTFENTSSTGGIVSSLDVPTNFALYQNYPNPFNPSTVISYQLAINSHVSIKVYDLLGREIVTLVQEAQHPGTYEIRFDARHLSSGTYFYKLQADNFVVVRKMTIMK